MLCLGLLITFSHFFFTTLASYPTQYSSDGVYNLKKPLVPVSKWAWIALAHFGINILNNYAFAYNISVPVHIILRSFGSVTTMLAGVLRGKRYSLLQVLSVAMLTVGVLISAWADAQSKVCCNRRLEYKIVCLQIGRAKILPGSRMLYLRTLSMAW